MNLPEETTTHISDGIVEMYGIASAILAAPEGSLSEWEENLLTSFIQMYWSDDQANPNGEDG